jgi:outer membrane protein insertion porin family
MKLHAAFRVRRSCTAQSAACSADASTLPRTIRWLAVGGVLIAWSGSVGCQTVPKPPPTAFGQAGVAGSGVASAPNVPSTAVDNGSSVSAPATNPPVVNGRPPVPGEMVVRGQDAGGGFSATTGQTIPPSSNLPAQSGALPAPAAYPGPPVEAIPPSFLTTDPEGNPAVDTTIPTFEPPIREAPVDIYATEARSGRFMIGGAVNSNAGLTGQIVLSEQNFDLFRIPRSWDDVLSGRAFRGAGQTFRLEAMPGTVFQRYMVTWTDPYLGGFLPFSLSVNGFLYDRIYQDWDENRLGGRVALGYRITPDLSLTVGMTGQNVDISDLRTTGIPYIDDTEGDHDLWSGEVKLSYFSLDHPFDPTEGYTLDLTYNQVFGSYDFPRGTIDFRKYFLLSQRADNSGRHTLSTALSLGVSGSDTPIFENFFAGGYANLRGFEFRGASPVEAGVQVGGRFQFLGSVEYKFPLTADDMLKGVVFFDYGTVEQDVEINWQNFRAAPGVGLRVNVPALGPAPLAFDFGFPIMTAAGDEEQVFAFYMGFNR